MAFAREVVRTPTAIGDITIQLFSADPTVGPQSAAHYRVHVVMSDGGVKVVEGDLVPHLTQTQINSLLAFMAAMRTKAVAEILP